MFGLACCLACYPHRPSPALREGGSVSGSDPARETRDAAPAVVGHTSVPRVVSITSAGGRGACTAVAKRLHRGPPIPIIYCDRCGTLPVPEEQLPVLLPRLEQFRPTGTAPLASIPAFINTRCPQCGGAARRETDVSDNFLDSAWYYLRYTSTEEHQQPWNLERVRRWLPVDHYAGGPEHTTMHHLYARFIAMVLHDMGYIPFTEPFKRLRLHGMITKNGAKISKSRGQSISPDDYIATYGADVFRMYMLFIGP